jgi:thiol-disulfide isomerase/thioredoxin
MDNKRRNAVIAAAVFAVVLVGAVVGYNVLGNKHKVETTTADSSLEATDERKMLADFDATVYDTAGEETTLLAVADGKPLVINFWATWCPYCVREMPDLQKVADDYEGRVSFAFVDCVDGRREYEESTAEWLAQNGYEELPVYYDSNREASIAFAARSLPTTVVVAADGEILSVTPGMIDPVLLRSELEEQV